jgi:hypothetical protein
MALYKSKKDIKKNKLFTGVKDSVLNYFFDQKDILEAREGEIIYRIGEESDAIYLIIKGEVKVKFSASFYVSTKIFNDFFGEKEIVDGTKRISSAMAFSNLVYYRLDKVVLRDLIKNTPLIDDNIRKYGELELPEVSTEPDRKITITERDKPVTFRMFSSRKREDEEKQNEPEPPAVVTQQLLPNFEEIEKSIEKDENIKTEENFEIGEELIDLNKVAAHPKAEEIDLTSDFDDEAPAEVDETIELTEDVKEEEKEPEEPEEPEPLTKPKPQQVESGINREIVRKMFLALNRIHKGVGLAELVSNTVQALKDLTNSESADLILVDEKLSSMQKIILQSGKIKIEYFQLSSGLTGICAVKKNPLNYDRPTKDSNFNPKIDQTGSARLKRILYFPLLTDAGETIAVIQTARENKKFTDEEVTYLTMLSKQLETAISRTITLEQLLKQVRLESTKKLKEVILKEIYSFNEIISSYTKLLSSKKLQQDADDIVRMIYKQAKSAADVTDSVFKTLADEIKPESSKIHFNDFIEGMLELFSEYCETREVKLFKKIGEGAIVDIDRSKLFTAIFMFIKTLVTDTRKAGKIYFSTDLINNMISIIIQNEGRGSLDYPDVDVLDYFHDRETISGDVVNLLLAAKIIFAHSGEVQIESTKGVGSIIRISLPVMIS